MGLDRVSEVRCLRKKIAHICEEGEVKEWHGLLSRQWMGQEPELTGVLYVDGHVRPSHGGQPSEKQLEEDPHLLRFLMVFDWEGYVQLTEAETAFRIQKSDLKIRPIWHQREDRTRAHILVCFLGYVLWKTLGRLMS